METVSSDVAGADFRQKGRLVMSLADAYHKDEELRARAEADPQAVLNEIGIPVPSGMEVRIWENTEEDFYLVMPPDPNVMLSDEALDIVAGGKSASTVGSAGSGGTVSTACTTASSASSAGSVGSAGTAG